MATMIDPDKYTYRVTWSPEDQEHVGLCAEYPSLSHLAKTAKAALAGIQRLVRDVVAEQRELGETPPEPLAIRRYSGQFKVRVPPELHRELTIEAAEANVSLNRLVSMKLGK